jgi:hypothetical protein
MVTRIALAATLIAATSSFAAAQSSTATSGTTAPMTSAPAANTTLPNGQPKWQSPPAARSGEKGLTVGEGAFNTPVEIKREK